VLVATQPAAKPADRTFAPISWRANQLEVLHIKTASNSHRYGVSSFSRVGHLKGRLAKQALPRQLGS